MRFTITVVVALAAAGAWAKGSDGGSDSQPGATRDIAELDLEALLNQDVRTQIVTVASRHEETVGDAPATVSVLTQDDFVRNDWRNVAEALRAAPGLYLSWGRDYYSTGVRGLAFPGDIDSRVLVLLDGHTLNNSWNAASNTGELLALPPEAIERVEVIRGPASSVYGSNAFFAVVNIVSRRPTDQKPMRLAVDALASSASLYRLAVSGHARAPFGLEVSGFGELLGGRGPSIWYGDQTRPRLNLGLPTRTGGLTRGTDYEDGAAGGITLAWKGLAVTAQLRNRNKGLPGAPGDSIFGDPYNAAADQHAFVEGSYRHSLGEHSFFARAYWDRFRSGRFSHKDPSDWETGAWVSLDPHVVSEGNADKVGGELQATLALHAADTLTVGAEVTWTRVTQPTYELDLITGLADPKTVTGGIKDASGNVQPIEPINVGGYLQNDWRPHEKFGLVVGLRYDFNTVFSRPESPLAALAPRATAIFKPKPEATLKLGYGEAFRTPTAFEAFFDDQSGVCGNSKAHPERQRTGELSGVYNLKKAYNLSASLYLMQVEGLLLRQSVTSCYVGSGPRQQFVNAGNVLVFGGEAALEVRLPKLNAFVNAGLTHTELTLTSQTHRPANSPTVVAGGGVVFSVLPDKLWASLRAHFVSARLDASLLHPVPPALRLEASLTARRVWNGLQFGITAITQNGLQAAALLDPITGTESVAHAVPQNLAEVRAHAGYEF